MVFSRQDIHSARLIAIIFLSKDLASPSSLVLGFFPFTQGSLPSLRFANASKAADPSLRSGFRLRLPLRSRLQNGRSLAAFGISPGGSRFAHASKTAQIVKERTLSPAKAGA